MSTNFAYFLLGEEAEVSLMKSMDDVWRSIERIEPMLGGYISLEAMNSLAQIFLGKKAVLVLTDHALADGSCFYRASRKLCEKVASAEHEDLLAASVPWSESKGWKDTDVNRMDLAGFLLEMAALCKQLENNYSLFVLFSKEG
ncbi:MAG: hypothetical protein KME35_08545 [Aphanocapsa sp. GSE-SYN-MK-11-07L]|jgi:hypothetical protein|nr:hypothetical protein [Aphanocapsa sp. GSE-SYN-MK-11-07L]